jgi:hypothetical protein
MMATHLSDQDRKTLEDFCQGHARAGTALIVEEMLGRRQPDSAPPCFREYTGAVQRDTKHACSHCGSHNLVVGEVTHEDLGERYQELGGIPGGIFDYYDFHLCLACAQIDYMLKPR